MFSKKNCPWKHVKLCSKVAHNRPKTFFSQVRPGFPNQPRIDFSYYKYVPRLICLLICGFNLQQASGMNSDQGWQRISKVATLLSTMHCYSTRKTHNISRFKKNNSTSIVQIQIIHAYFLLLRPLNWGSVDSGMKIILVESASVHPFAQCCGVRCSAVQCDKCLGHLKSPTANLYPARWS